MGLGWQDKLRMPESNKDSGCKNGLPILLSGNSLVHELEELVGVIVHFDINLYRFERRFRDNRICLR